MCDFSIPFNLRNSDVYLYLKSTKNQIPDSRTTHFIPITKTTKTYQLRLSILDLLGIYKNAVCKKRKFMNIDPLKTRETASEGEEGARREGT